jgi:hypothetical protein
LRRYLLYLALVGTPAVASAGPLKVGEPKFEYGKPDDVEKVSGIEWNATAEAGLVLTTGNSETTSATGGLKVSRRTGRNKLALEASAAYAKAGLRVLDDKNGNGMIDSPDEIDSSQTITAETLAAKLRYDFFFTSRNSFYVASLAARDVPAGKESVLGAQFGYSRQLRKTKTAETVGELGYDLSRENLVTGKPLEIQSARVFVGHKATLVEGSDVDVSGELLTNLNTETLVTGRSGGPFRDTRLNFKLAISAKVAKNLAVQTSFEAHYDNRPGPLPVKDLAMGFVPEAATLDTIMKAQFIYTFTAKKPK